RRGPDDEGVARWPSAVLAQRRLAVLDVSSAGHQPMLSDDGTVGLVFNGCIYNFKEIRQRLAAEGMTFRSNCDTEVILRGYQCWGMEKLLPQMRGMFAIAVWDNLQEKLTLVRDRLGVKPLCYEMRDGQLAFASTVGSLRAAGLGGELSPQAILEYLEFGFITDDAAIYEGIHKLPPATMLVWERGKATEQVYWRCNYEPDRSSTFAEAVEQTEEHLLDAVRLRLVTDVPIAALLSGGIDSTLVCWALSKLGANIRTFTVGLPGEKEDESAAASETAKILNLPQQHVTLDPKAAFTIESLTAAFSEPFSSYSAMAMEAVSAAIKPEATVVLTGDGGDEAFLGYPVHKNALLAQRIARRLPAAAAGGVQELVNVLPNAGRLKRAKSLLTYATGGLGATVKNHDGLPYYQKHGLFGPKLLDRTIAQRELPLSLDSARNLLPQLLAFNSKTELTGEFLTKVDGATMYHAIEARSPFLDHRLWEFAASLRFGVRLHRYELKSILRQIVRNRVGEGVAQRPKQGFNIPVSSWLVKEWRHRLCALATASRLEREGIVEQPALRRVVQNAIEQDRANIHLWRLTVLEAWLARAV
ncbi:MAG TPA: asparagine synthase (glutamine-hydrolyzing), partial [Bryobacteraceae bacterium]|nr:asparagine synthase (glutamine-hydrolyzing) [Bryobacteraceae bacterium]